MAGNIFSRQRDKLFFWKKIFYAVLILLLLLNIVIRVHHPHFGLEKIPGFWAVFGLAGALVLGKLSKAAAHTILGRNEDFYDRH